MESSTQNRHATLIEEVRYKARMTNNGGDHLKKWRMKMQTLREEEERGTKEYIEDMKRRKEEARLRSEVNRSAHLEQVDTKHEEIELEQYRSRVKLLKEEIEMKECEERLRSLEMRLAAKAQNQALNMDFKLSPLKTRNTELMHKIMTIQDNLKDREMKNFQSYINREKRRLRAIENR